MADRRLAATVHVHEGEDGVAGTFVFEAGTVPPPWAVALITNPDAWGETPPGVSPADGDGGTSPSPSGVGGVPPRHGAGSSRAAWAAYADTVGVDVDEDMSRDDIIAAVDPAGG